RSALSLQSIEKMLGKLAGRRAWTDFRSQNDPEAPTTVAKRSFPYEIPPRHVAKGCRAMPEQGSVQFEPVQGGSGQSGSAAGEDNTDTFVVPLCNADGSKPALNSDHYLFRGQWMQIEELGRVNSWTPSAADQTRAETGTLRPQRTALGLVFAGANGGATPV